MNQLEIIIAFVLGGLGALLATYLCWLIVRLIPGVTRGALGASKFRRALRNSEQIDILLENNKYLEALDQLQRMIVLDTAPDQFTINTLKEHHQNMLSRCLVIAEALGCRVENIAEVESLFIARAELQLLLLKAQESYGQLKERRKGSGKQLPTWTKTEFEQRKQDIQQELETNRTALIQELNNFFTQIREGKPNSTDITYH